MKLAPGGPWRRLVPLTVIVLAVHLVLLREGPELIVPMRPDAVRFQTRTVRLPPPAVTPEPAAAPAPVAAPTPPAAVVPAPRPARTPEAPAAPPPPSPAPPPSEPAPEAAQPAPPAAEPPAPAATLPRRVPLSERGGSPAPQALALPEPARMNYEVTAHARGFELRGKARLEWKHDGQNYEARLEASSPLLPSRVQRSAGRITDDGLAPEYFSDKARGEQATHFDREKGRLVFSNNRPTAPITEGMQDRLSVVVQLSILVASEPARFTPGTRITIPTASTREAENWIFSVEEEEDLQLPGGKVRALKLQRLPRKEYDQKVELWLAPGMDYAPVRLRLTNPNGDAVDQRWSSTDRG